MDYRERNYYLVGWTTNYEYVARLLKTIPSVILRPINDWYYAVGRSLSLYPSMVVSCRKEYVDMLEQNLEYMKDERSMFRNYKKLTKEILGQ